MPTLKAQNYDGVENRLIYHVFLPLKLPGHADTLKIDIEADLLELISKTLNDFNPTDGVDYPKTKTTFNNWKNLQAQEHLDPKIIFEQIRNITPGEIFALYIRTQNAGLMISVPKLEFDQEENENEINLRFKNLKAIFSTFPASQRSDIVTIRDDLATVFPSTSVAIKNGEFLTSKCFARQLSDLSKYEMVDAKATTIKSGQVQIEAREVSDPKFISKWLTAALCDSQSECSTDVELPRVVKKIRDSVIFDDCLEPFRRSGMWMTAKVILQISLIQELGNRVDGTILYKILMTKLMLSLLKSHPSSKLLHASILFQMMSKIARRCYKIQNYLKRQKVRPSLGEDFKLLCDEAIKHFNIISKSLKGHFEKIINEENDLSKAQLQIQNAKFFLKHPFSNSDFTNYLNTKHFLKMMADGVAPPHPIPRLRTYKIDLYKILEYNVKFEDGVIVNENLGLLIYDLEQNVRYYWDDLITLDEIFYAWRFYQSYLAIAKPFYGGDAIGNSRMILTSMKIIQVCDTVIRRYLPILSEHRTGVPLVHIENLQVPERADLELINELEEYFTKREKCEFPGLLEEDKVTINSFASRYVEKETKLQNFREQILQYKEGLKERKLEELKIKKQEWERLIAKINGMECEYIYRKNWFRTHSRECGKCKLIKRAENMSVTIFEEPLPIQQYEQNAVIFELFIPSPIACLRDIIYLFSTKVIMSIASRAEQSALYGPWTNYIQLKKYSRRSNDWFINLISTSKSFLESHYKELHVSNPESDFFRRNGMNTFYGNEKDVLQLLYPVDDSRKIVKKMVTFKVDKRTPYASLQWAVNGMELTQNEVLANQYQAHKDLTLLEYVEFGSLRSGYRIQLRNIYNSLTKRSLSLKSTSVLNLICQSIWQAGPAALGDSNKILRDAHNDLEDGTFANEYLSLMESLVEAHKGNWKDHNILLIIISITTRIASLTNCNNTIVRSLDILLKCRKTAIDWSNQVQNILSSLIDVPRKEIDELRLKIIEINVCVALTFSVEESLISFVIDEDSSADWLQAIANIFDNQALASTGQKIKLSTNLRNLLRRVLETGSKIQRSLDCLFASNCKGIFLFVTKHYPGSKALEISENDMWQQYDNNLEVYYCELLAKGYDKTKKSTLQINVITGCFLVDAVPVANLPAAIENHPDFQIAFPNKLFAVRPYPFQAGRMMTIDKFNSCESYYSFFLQDNSLIITEHRGERQEKWQMIPQSYMKKNVSYLLVNNCTHWYNKKTKIIEFYHRHNEHPTKLTETKPLYTLDMNNNNFIRELSTGRLLVDINCQAYRQIVEILQRLELPKFINVWTSRDTRLRGHFEVELPRIGLCFFVRDLSDNYIGREYRNSAYPDRYPKKSSYCMTFTSKEYRGMKISSSRLQTLVGLRNGILLEDAEINAESKQRPIFLVPFGKVELIGEQDVGIVIDSTSTGESRFFTYEIDPYLNQIKAGESKAAWAYLALLHAVTSSPIPDPFLKSTGTERALQILQSAQCWNCEPMDKELLLILNEIAKISPRREYYPQHMKTMERVAWPEYLSSQAAHDGFQIVIEKLIYDSNRLIPLFPSISLEAQDSVYLASEKHLATKAYWRRLYLTTEEGRINSKFDDRFALDRAPNITNVSTLSFDMGFSEESFENAIRLSHLVHDGNIPLITGTVTNYLRDLLLNGQDLKGVSEEGFPIRETVHIWSEFIYRNEWLDIYNLARKVDKLRLKTEWLFILTSFGFRKHNAVPLNHLYLLQTIAIHSNLFVELNPPPFCEYFNTSEYEFSYERTVESLLSNVKTFEDFLDRNCDIKEERESIEDFVERMREEREKVIEDEVQTFATFIKNNLWPTENINLDLLEVRNALEKLTEIDISEALIDLNFLLKNWYKNRLLNIFLVNVELIISNIWSKREKNKFLLEESCNSEYLKGLDRPRLQGILKEFTRKKPFTIDLIDILKQKENYIINEELLNDCKKIFNNLKDEGSSSSSSLSDESQDHENNQNAAATFKENVTKRLAQKDFPLKMNLNEPIIKEYMNDLEDSWNKSLEGVEQIKTPDIYFKHKVIAVLRTERGKALELWEKIREAIKPWAVEKIGFDQVIILLNSAGIFPRISQLSLFRFFLDLHNERVYDSDSYPFIDYLKELIGAYGVLLTKYQQAARCVKYTKFTRGKMVAELEYKSEKENPGHTNWIPSLNPEWLIFEIEMDLMIRPIQATVAEKMINPDGNVNSLLQLNMGEGKTAVIVPLLAIALANKRQLCRVTVLKSLYEINRRALVFRIGGLLLNRRVYNFPCRRDFSLNEDVARKMLDIYHECLEKQGVVMTVPEYRLSFELKAYEKCGAGNYRDGREFFKVQDWLKSNIRDVLDESDEILQVKYQLIYTLGEQIPLGGGSLRWKIIQILLKLVPGQLKAMQNKFGPTCAEIKERKQKKFPFCRILDIEYNKIFTDMMAKCVLNGNVGIPEVQSSNKDLIYEFLINTQLTRNEFDRVFKLYPNTIHQEKLLILRGMLACGVLATSLNKRWRVNFGVNPSGYRRMAVPFRAKDVAAERTEFGHPDVAITLTQFSYYYSGLSDEQLDHCFSRLQLLPDPKEEYERWIEQVSKETEGYDSIRHLSGINLQDHYQRTKLLFPVLRKNVATIDFWLSSVVYPAESKQFGLKIGCSPWDLSIKTRLPTTGFSGTNDSKLLLPKTITQNDLPELQGTNGIVLQNLFREENNNYEVLNQGITGRQILEKLHLNYIRVLLDVGALLLELNNKEVAVTWLKMVEEVDAAVYFDDNNKLVVIERTGCPVSLELSTFRTRLDRCVIYLDDIHTRGTDLKIPEGTKACVTLGRAVTKDKLVQGCMRMRKLGFGHSLVFWASAEVDNAIKANIIGKDSNTAIGVREVLKWSIDNNINAIKDGFIHWINAGVYQAQKQSAQYIYAKGKQNDQALKLLADSCSQREVVELMAMYAEPRKEKTYPTIAEHLLKRINRILDKQLSKSGSIMKFDVGQIVEFFGSACKEHSQKYVFNEVKCTQLLDEEQERELEHEMEAQHEKEVPNKVKAYTPLEADEVYRFLRYGTLNKIEKWAVKLPLTLKNTRIWKEYPDDTWSSDIYATLDFNKVIKPSTNVANIKSDDFLRPPNYFATVAIDEKKTIILFLSPFEADLYIPDFRTKNMRATLRPFAPRLYPDQDTLYKNPKLALPSSNWFIPNISIPQNSCLLLYSGSSYFENFDEAQGYCHYTGFCPRPRSEQAEKLFEEGGIIDGFINKQVRNQLGNIYEICHFNENPQELIRKIIEGRYKAFSNNSHIGTIILRNLNPFVN